MFRGQENLGILRIALFGGRSSRSPGHGSRNWQESPPCKIWFILCTEWDHHSLKNRQESRSNESGLAEHKQAGSKAVGSMVRVFTGLPNSLSQENILWAP